MTALLIPVEARPPGVLLWVGRPAGVEPLPEGVPAAACARVPIVLEAETTGAEAAGRAAVDEPVVGVAAGDGVPAVRDAGFS